MMTDWVRLKNAEFSCSIGVFEGERGRRQPLAVDLAFGLNLDAAATDELSHTVDYFQSLAEARFIAESAHFGLIESLAVTLCHWFLSASRSVRVERVQVTIRKPEACGGQGFPEVEITRDRAWLEQRPSGRARTGTEIIQQTPSVWVARLQFEEAQGCSAGDLPLSALDVPVPQKVSLMVSSGLARSEDGRRTFNPGDKIAPGLRIRQAGDAPLQLLVVAELAPPEPGCVEAE